MVSLWWLSSVSYLTFAKQSCYRGSARSSSASGGSSTSSFVPLLAISASALCTNAIMATSLPSSSSGPAHKRARIASDLPSSNVPLLRRASTSLASTTSSGASSDLQSTTVSGDGIDNDDEATLQGRAQHMADRAAGGVPLTGDEVEGVVESIQNLLRAMDECQGNANNWAYRIDDARLRELLRSAAHLSHKDWKVTEANADVLLSILFPTPTSNGDEVSSFDEVAPILLERIMSDGNWRNAESHAASRAKVSAPASAGSGAASSIVADRPWAVLVTGVNGIRKTTSMYQPWFPHVLAEALIAPSESRNGDTLEQPCTSDLLPTGQNSFFRQLDHMIATLCNREFELLYRMTEQECKALAETKADKDSASVPPEVVGMYTNLKAAIFSRYRTLSELLGALLLKQARKRQMNCLMETSGKDIAMFQYVDHFLPQHRKLALRFQINKLDLAKASVDERMTSEILAGMQARTVQQIIQSNQGGPYGSQVLPDIQRDSDAVWHEQVATNRGVGNDWYKATIQIGAHPDRPWTAQAVRPDGTLGTLHEFLPKKE